MNGIWVGSQMPIDELQRLVDALRDVGVRVFERNENGIHIRLELGSLPASACAPETAAPEKLSERQRLEQRLLPED